MGEEGYEGWGRWEKREGSVEEGYGIGSDIIPSVLKNDCVHWFRYAHTWLVVVLVVWYARERVWCSAFPYRTSLRLPHAHDSCISIYGIHGVMISQASRLYTYWLIHSPHVLLLYLPICCPVRALLLLWAQ
jgi:hypothetical protein